MFIYILIALKWLLISPGTCENILFLHTCVSYSHRVSSWPFVEALSAKGHNVTFIGPFPPTIPIENVTDIVPKRLSTFVNEVIGANFDVTNRASGLTPKFIMIYDYVCMKACEELFQSEEIQNWLKSSPKVDLIFVDTASECAYGLAHKFKAKLGLILPLTFLSKYNEAFAVPPDTSIPDWDITYKPPLSFFNRIVGSLIPLIWRLSQLFYYPKYTKIFKESLDLKDIPDLDDIQQNTSLILINGNYIEDYPRSYPPLVVKVPGLHVKSKHSPLEKDLEEFINSKNSDNSSNEGFFYISFGTVAKGPNLPMEIRETFFKTIDEFPNIRFIWRWDGVNPPNVPRNLYLKPWLEQEDLLAHSKIRGFITQAGRPSMQESLLNGVPTITFPILGDQDFNAHRFEMLGTSINLDIVGIKIQSLKNAIKKLLTDSSYKKRTEQLAILSKDVPMSSIATAIWHTEFVLRHSPEELSLLRPLSQKLTWYQRRELDVWAFNAFIVIAFLSLIYLILRRILKKLFSKVITNSNCDKTKIKKT